MTIFAKSFDLHAGQGSQYTSTLSMILNGIGSSLKMKQTDYPWNRERKIKNYTGL